MSENAGIPPANGAETVAPAAETAAAQDGAEGEAKPKQNAPSCIIGGGTHGRLTKRKFQFDGCFPAARAQAVPVKLAKREPVSNVRVLSQQEPEATKSKKKGAKAEAEGAASWVPVRLTSIGQRTLQVPKALQAKYSIPVKAANLSFAQIGNSGPAAYMPDEVAVHSVEDAASFFDSFSPASRPMLVALPAGEGEKERKDGAGLARWLGEKGKGLVVELRTVEGVAMAPDSSSTFRRSAAERVALLPGASLAALAPDLKVETDHDLPFLIACFVYR